MPNWVSTYINFHGDKNDIKQVFYAIGSKDSSDSDKRIFDFNRLIPMPESYNGIEASSRTDHAYVYFFAKKFGRLPEDSYYQNIQEVVSETEKDNTPSKLNKLVELGQKVYNNVVNYGAKDWYQWCTKNWGTKWNAYECYAPIPRQSMSFQTAWSFPTPVIEKLADVCKKQNVTFDGEWADEASGDNAGWFHCDDVDGFSFNYYDDGSSAAYEAYLNCWGDTDCIGQDDDGNYFHYDCDTCPNKCY